MLWRLALWLKNEKQQLINNYDWGQTMIGFVWWWTNLLSVVHLWPLCLTTHSCRDSSLKIEISPIYYSPQRCLRHWWHFLVRIIVLTFHGGKKFHAMNVCCDEGLNNSRETRHVSILLMLVSSKCPEDLGVQSLSPKFNINTLFLSKLITVASWPAATIILALASVASSGSMHTN